MPSIIDGSDNFDTGGVYARVHMSANTALVSGTPTKLAFDTIDDESAITGFNTGLNRYVVPVTGFYMVSFGFTTSVLSVGDTTTSFIYVDGAAVNRLQQLEQASTAKQLTTAYTTGVHLTAGQYVEIFVSSTTAASESVRGSESSLSFARIG